jgi:diguanylate cyclase (GGDEF)-like protein
MKSAHPIANWLRIDASRPELMRAQYNALTTHVPLLYFVLAINTALAASQFMDSAPTWMTLGVPGVMAVLLAARVAIWLSWRGKPVSDEMIRYRMLRTAWIGAVLGAVLVAWSLRLYALGTPLEKGYIVFYIGITSVSSVMSLIHLPAAALGVTGVVALPFAAYLVARGHEGTMVLVVNMLLVIGVLIYVLYVYSQAFSQLFDTKSDLERKRGEAAALGEENWRLAHLDTLTGLANRRQFFANFEAGLASAAEQGRRFAIGLIDLDGFKPVNDGYGHNVGDAVLREVGARLSKHGGEGVFFARLGGDEFAILAEDDASTERLSTLSESLCATLRAPYHVCGMEVTITATIGFAAYPDAGLSTETLYERADYALYTAKENGRGGMQVFTPELQEALAQSKTVELALHRADLDKEFYLEFQPIFDIDKRRPSSFEALARWKSPTLGQVRPDRFIRMAEKSGLIHRLTRVLLGKALAQAATWPQDISLSFNLSMRDLTSREAMLAIVSQIVSSGFPPTRLTLEITESAFMRDYESAAESLDMLKRLGVKISLDDFGTGYSSLSYVHQLPLDKIKIDRSFVRALGGNHPTRDVIRTILALCENLKLDCVAEGMETPDEVEALRDLGCRRMQGFYFSRPVGPDKIAGLLEPDRERISDAA